MIKVEGLYKSYGRGYAVNDVNFTVNDGEVVGFLGVNGAGKSTTMNILAGCLSPTKGKVEIDGFDIVESPIEAKRRIGYLPEIPPVYTDMTVREYLNFMYDLKKARFPKQPHIDEICDVVKLNEVMQNRLIKHLSKGYRQRVGLAQALIGNPKVLILDEPTVGLDPKQIIEIRELINRLGQNHTVILSSHILSEVQQICGRIIIINQGKIIADDSYDKLAATLAGENALVARIMGNEEDVTAQLSDIKGVLKVSRLASVEPGTVDYKIVAEDGADVRKPVFERMASRKMPVLLMKGNEDSLEQMFLKLIDQTSEYNTNIEEQEEE